MKLPSHIGRFRILDVLGQGAMGIVYRGHDDALERHVAIKVMSAAVLHDKESKERFLREARASARLQHPNIVTIYELGEHEGMPFMALELLEGQDLQRAIEAGIRPDPRLTLPIVLQLLAGLGHAHDHGIIHRDVKPSNVFLTASRPVKIMDFGVARMGGAGMATQNIVVGTPNYMSPEQVKAGHLDGRSDLFSAGLILYELVTGEKCLQGNTVVELLYKIVHQDRDLSALPRGHGWDVLRDSLQRSLQREPEARYGSAQEMSRDLSEALRQLGGGNDWSHASDLGMLLRTPAVARPIPQTLVPDATAGGGFGTRPGGPPGSTVRPTLETQPQPTDELPRPTLPQPRPAPARVRPATTAGRPVWPLAAAGGVCALLLAFGLWRLLKPTVTPPSPSPTSQASARPSPSPSPSPTGVRSPHSRSSSSLSLGPGPGPSPVQPSSPRPLASPTAVASGSPSPGPSAGPSAVPTGSPTPIASPSDPGTVEPVQNPRLERAERLLEDGRFAAALAEAKAILAREPGNASAREVAQEAEASLQVEIVLRRAREALARGDKDGAIEELQKGLSIRPNDSRLLDLWRQATQ